MSPGLQVLMHWRTLRFRTSQPAPAISDSDTVELLPAEIEEPGAAEDRFDLIVAVRSQPEP
jgi:hypothetical protein